MKMARLFFLSASNHTMLSSSIQLFFLVPQWKISRNANLGFSFISSSMNDDSTSVPKQTPQLDYDSSVDLFRLEVEQHPRNYISSETPKARSWFGPNSQYIRELPCPSCRGRGYTPCTECGIERSRIDCSQCNGKGIKTCKQCLGESVIWEESIDERPWEKARSISPLKVKEDDEVDNLDIKLDVEKRAKRVYHSQPPKVRLKISRTLKSLNAKTGLFTKHMKILHQDPKLHAQRVAAIKKAKGTPEARKQVSDALKAYFSDPENRRKRSISMIGTTYKCSRCGREGHRRHQCPELKKAGIVSRWRCGLCGERGHNRKGCPKSKSSEPKRKDVMERRCRVCGQRGHNSRTCAHKIVVVRRDVMDRHCRVCGQSGHNSRTCARGKQLTEVPSLASPKNENAKGTSEGRSAALKAYYSDPENRRKRSNSMTAYYSDPENRLKKSVITKESKYHCSGCGKEGHRRHYCPELIKAGKVSVWKCGLCKETGHNRLVCPKLKEGLISSERQQQRVIPGQGTQ